MIEGMEIRTSRPVDAAAIETLYPDAFPDEDLLPLVRELLEQSEVTLSLVAMVDQALVGHVMFTACTIARSAQRISMLGPLAVAPAWQKRGAGSALVREGLKRLESAGVIRVFVLGDPAYYQRFGFQPEADIAPPYALPKEWSGAWQSVGLGAGGHLASATLSVPESWRQPELWAP